MQDSGCTAAFATYPPAASNQPVRAVPTPPPILTPRDEQEYIVPSIRLPVVRYAQWAEDILKRHPDFNKDNAKSIIEDEIGKAFLEVLEDAGVFKRNENGQKAFKEFITSIHE